MLPVFGRESVYFLCACVAATVVNLVKKVLYTDEGTEQDDGKTERLPHYSPSVSHIIYLLLLWK